MSNQIVLNNIELPPHAKIPKPRGQLVQVSQQQRVVILLWRGERERERWENNCRENQIIQLDSMCEGLLQETRQKYICIGVSPIDLMLCMASK